MTKAPSPTRTAATAPAAMFLLPKATEEAPAAVVEVAAAAWAAAAEAWEAREAETLEAEAKIPARAVEAADRTELAASVCPAARRPLSSQSKLFL